MTKQTINIAYAAAAFTLLSSIIASVYVVENRFAKASDLINTDAKIDQLKTELKAESKKNATDLRRAMIEDQLFELDMRVEEGVATSVDRARIKRYKRQLQELR